MVDGSAGTRPSCRRACAWMRGEARAAESCDWSAAFPARRFVRSCVALSRLTKTTPASSRALTAIHAIAPCERVWRRRALGAGRGLARGRVRAGATTTAAVVSAKLHRDAKAGRLRTRVACDLRRRRADRPSRRRAQRRAGAAGTDRELGRTRAPVFLVAQEALDDPILERVEGDDREASVRPEHLERRRERALQRAELVVHLDAQRLEDALGRVAFPEPRGSG